MERALVEHLFQQMIFSIQNCELYSGFDSCLVQLCGVTCLRSSEYVLPSSEAQYKDVQQQIWSFVNVQL